MRLNSIGPADGAARKRKRRGRGIGSGLGKTGGRGHKGQKSRSGGYHKVGFEGGQMPLQRRLPKFGFRSRSAAATAEVRLAELARLEGVVDMEVLRGAGLVRSDAQRAKVFLSGTLDKALHLKGIGATAGARRAIEAAGGKVED